MKTIFDGFELDGISYYRSKDKYYADDMTICKVITYEEYKYALTDKFIKGV